jgi:hypothetical protein
LIACSGIGFELFTGCCLWVEALARLADIELAAIRLATVVQELAFVRFHPFSSALFGPFIRLLVDQKDGE